MIFQRACLLLLKWHHGEPQKSVYFVWFGKKEINGEIIMPYN